MSPRQQVVEAAGLGRRSATRVMTSAKEARGAKAVPFAALDERGDPCPVPAPRVRPGNSAFSRIRARGRLVRSTMFETVSNPPVIEHEAQSRTADRLDQLCSTRPRRPVRDYESYPAPWPSPTSPPTSAFRSNRLITVERLAAACGIASNHLSGEAARYLHSRTHATIVLFYQRGGQHIGSDSILNRTSPNNILEGGATASKLISQQIQILPI